MDIVKCNADLHIHGLYSGAVSKEMVPSKIAEQAPLKGLDIIATGDILNARWIRQVKENLNESKEHDGIFEYKNGTKFILQTEINDADRIHHIILFPNFSKVEEVREAFMGKCKDLDIEGRPTIHLNGEEIAEICLKADCLLGFSHAFTPYFGLYSKYDSYKECYGKYWNKIYFMELGLSADTNMADRISELHNLSFTSNSDAHSPWPNKLGREFNVFQLHEISFEEIKKALKREGNRKCILNMKFNPLEGKYHKTRCQGCLKFYEPDEAISLKWRCPNCNKHIKKGVDYRIHELADIPGGEHPEHRPKCVYIIPLSEIISLSLNVSNAWSIKVQSLWKKFIEVFGNEINVLLNAEINEIEKIDKEVAKYIGYFRENKIKYIPGGAGVYGRLIKPGYDGAYGKSLMGRDGDLSALAVKKTQKSLTDF